MIMRRNYLIGAAAMLASNVAVPWVTAPHMVRAANLMAIRGTVMPIRTQLLWLLATGFGSISVIVPVSCAGHLYCD